MPRDPHKLPKYQLHKDSGQARVSLGGRDIYLGPYDSDESRERYQRLIAEWIAAGRDARLMERNCPVVLIEDVIGGYWRHCKGYYQRDGEPTKTVPNIRGRSNASVSSTAGCL